MDYGFGLYRGESRQKEIKFETNSSISPEVGMQVRRREEKDLLTTMYHPYWANIKNSAVEKDRAVLTLDFSILP